MYKTNQINKRRILVVEDNDLNRSILRSILERSYDVIEAVNGRDGLAMLKQHREELSLVLLDVYMPVCDGFEFLAISQSDPFMASVPVIVTTGSDKREDEEKCLRMGATDFISKPYQPEVILGRIGNIIRYRESLTTLAIVEYDDITGLYTMSAFLHHASQRIIEEPCEHDLVVWQIRDYAILNSTYGEDKAYRLLHFIAQELRRAHPLCLVARQDKFFYMLGTPSERLDTGGILAHNKLINETSPIPNLRVNTGVYLNIPAGTPLSVACDRAKMTLRYATGDGKVAVAYYNEAIEHRLQHEKEVLMAFEPALDKQRFEIRLQPMVDATTGRIRAAEALVRWLSEDGRVLSPADFIPLLEREALIWRLDEYVFRCVCELQKKRRVQGKESIAISINLSRGSLYREDIISKYKGILQEYGVEISLVPIEITESAVITDEKLTERCAQLARAGFTLHIDDFGSGYSSLSSLAVLPFSELKIDKSLIDHIDTQRGAAVISGIVETGRALGIKVLAEGVERAEQALALVRMECDLIQGYHYAPPMEVDAFETLVQEESPFFEKRISRLSSKGVARVNEAEFKRYLKACSMLFSHVRVLKAPFCSCCDVTQNGTLEEEKGPCYAIWKREQRCNNCTTLRSLETKHTEHKFEVCEDEIYLVYSAYIEVDGVPHIIELLNEAGNDVIHGYRRDPTFIDVLRDGSRMAYEDVLPGVYNRLFYEEQRGRLWNITALVRFELEDVSCGATDADRLRQEVTAAVKQCIRRNDYIIRLEEDRFLTAFTDLDRDYLPQKLQSIRKAIEEITLSGQWAGKASFSITGCLCDGLPEYTVAGSEHLLFE